jgi:hypothetical protein
VATERLHSLGHAQPSPPLFPRNPACPPSPALAHLRNVVTASWSGTKGRSDNDFTDSAACMSFEAVFFSAECRSFPPW